MRRFWSVALIILLASCKESPKGEPQGASTVPPVERRIEAAAASSSGSSTEPKVSEPSLPAAVLAAIKADAAASHPNDYSTQAYVVKNQSAAYRTLQTYAPTEMSEDAYGAVRRAAEESHSNDFSTQLYVVRNQVKAYSELKIFAPSGVPRDVLVRITEAAEASHPNDYSTQLYVMKNQVKAYEEVNH